MLALGAVHVAGSHERGDGSELERENGFTRAPEPAPEVPAAPKVLTKEEREALDKTDVNSKLGREIERLRLDASDQRSPTRAASAMKYAELNGDPRFLGEPVRR